MSIKCGIVGLPNVGKSTLFNCLTRAEIPAENYPFCTIDPNTGIVPVPDPRLDALAAIVKPEKVIPTTMEFVDIAGLVAGASRGEGLGNKFLAHIRETDAIAHIVRCFDDDDVTHVAGRVDPLDDIETIDTELVLADLDTAERALERARKQSKSGDRTQLALAGLLERVVAHLGEGHPLRAMELTGNERASLKTWQFITAKPVLYVANVDDAAAADNPRVTAVREHAEAEGSEVVVICAAMEAELAQLEPDEQAEFLADLGETDEGEPMQANIGRFGPYVRYGNKFGPADLLHRGAEGSPRLDRAPRRHGAGGGRTDPHRLPEGLHPRRGHRLRGLHRLQRRGRRQGVRQAATGGQGVCGEGRGCGAFPLQRLEALRELLRGRLGAADGCGGTITVG